MGRIIPKPKKWDAEEIGETYSAYTIVHPGTIMVNGLNLEFDFVTQRVAIVEEDGIITSAYIAMSPNDFVDADYMCYLLKAYDYRRALHNMGKGLRKILNYSELKTKPILLPPLSEQGSIVKALNTECARIDAVIEQTRASIEEYKKLKQTVITQAVTKGIRLGRKMKDSGVEWIGVVPKEWAVTKLKYFSGIRSGITLGKTYPRDTKLVEYPYLRVANVQGSYTDLTDVATILVTEEEAEKYRLHDGELLMTEGGDRDKLGRGTVWHAEIDPCLHQNHVFALTTNDDLSAEYVSFLSASFVGRDYFDVTANQSVHLASTNSTTIMNFTIPVPKIEEQQEIVSYLSATTSDLEKLIAKKETLISDLESYKKSLIYEYVTGKTEVPHQQETLAISFVDMRALLMCRIVELMEPKGRIHLQKALDTVDCLSGINDQTQYVRQTHGPYDPRIEEYESAMVKHGWATAKPGTSVEYGLGKNYAEYREIYQRCYRELDPLVEKICIFLKPMRTSQAGRVATLLAAWNDFLLDEVSPTDAMIIQEVRGNWTPNKAHSEEETWFDTLRKIKDNDLIPKGVGLHTIPKAEG